MKTLSKALFAIGAVATLTACQTTEPTGPFASKIKPFIEENCQFRYLADGQFAMGKKFHNGDVTLHMIKDQEDGLRAISYSRGSARVTGYYDTQTDKFVCSSNDKDWLYEQRKKAS